MYLLPVCNKTISVDFKNVKKEMNQIGSIAFKALDNFSKGLKSLMSGVEERKYMHKMVLGSLFMFSVNPSPGLSSMIEIVDSVFEGADFFSTGKYFFSKETKVSFKEGNGRIDIKKKRINQTEAGFHLERGKPQRVISNLSFIASAFSSLVLLLDSTKVLHLAEWGAKLGNVPIFGSHLSKIVAPAFFSTGALLGAVVGFGALTVDSGIYLYKAYHGDADKDLTKGWLQLSSRVAALALYSLMLIGVSQAVVIAPLTLTVGVLGLASLLYTNSYKENKKEVQKDVQPQLLTKYVLQEGIS
ncbi:hypothetical protein N9Y92_02650 [Chlamydiales bacterium]|nr:hypothetical protein [Chlamydiales bacterium]